MDAYLYDPINQRDFSNLFSFMRWNPVPWMEYRSEMQAPILGKEDVYKRQMKSFPPLIRMKPSPAPTGAFW